ncbi:P-loop containing nucleoside triphosphate hydrolase protein [Rhizoclosmatium globosum]|uniref:p-loop containing nucleoside triphosphate hydrolase protein n=1 Tax=Rhizoclosmatium globosum TaxID=329046 RepID=A0A1Y2CBP4_9FUNG|nr:P-loop containing nucleoside triphosphate hydrolase protein [Rhizoclosmatium globosum]|eukprot:ORY44460.1 P-loop containing nucleoside triphosphate hydrolase protein [Rhizoclosmatium globosum]
MTFTAAEEKLLSQRDFVERQIAKFHATANFKVSDVSPEDETGNGDDDRDVVVCVRVRPLLEGETQRGLFPAVTTTPANTTEDKIFVHSVEKKVTGLPRLATKDFGVDHAFGQTSLNEEVYQKAARSLIPIALGGGVGSLFASGQTGSGKTHTMTAIENMIARDLFQFAREYRCQQDGLKLEDVSDSADFEYRASFFELLGNKARDLLNYPTEVSILEDVLGQVQVVGVTEEQVKTPDELTSIISRGSSFRKTIGTAKNDTSSRSHAICRIKIKNLRRLEAEEGVLYLLDLAGSESASDSRNHDKERMQESVEINKSLTTLKDCIRNRALAVVSTKHIHIPYRNSKLTVLLKSAFELSSVRACKTVVIATINPNILDTNHSLNTLRYVSPLKVEVPPITEAASPNDPVSWSNTKLQEWVKQNSTQIDPAVLCPTETGKQLLKLPEATFIDRCCECPGVSPVAAKKFYTKFWRLVVLARTKIRQDREDALQSVVDSRKKANDAEYLEFLERLKSDPQALARWMESRRRYEEYEKRVEEDLKDNPVLLAHFKEERKQAREWREENLEKADLIIDQILEKGSGREAVVAMAEVLKKVKEGADFLSE